MIVAQIRSTHLHMLVGGIGRALRSSLHYNRAAMPAAKVRSVCLIHAPSAQALRCKAAAPVTATLPPPPLQKRGAAASQGAAAAKPKRARGVAASAVAKPAAAAAAAQEEAAAAPSGGRQHFLMKSEPDVFSIDMLEARPAQTEPWDGERLLAGGAGGGNGHRSSGGGGSQTHAHRPLWHPELTLRLVLCFSPLS